MKRRFGKDGVWEVADAKDKNSMGSFLEKESAEDDLKTVEQISAKENM